MTTMTPARVRAGRARIGRATARLGVVAMLLAIAAYAAAQPVLVKPIAGPTGPRACSQTAQTQFAACMHESNDDRLTGKAICINLADNVERKTCLSELGASSQESNRLCREQRDARFDVCAAVGEGRYDPDFDPADFDDDFTSAAHQNPYFPVKIGFAWEFAAVAANETNTVEVLAQTKLIEGVTCVVSRDLVSASGVAKEFTDDWLGQALSGDVVYCGEEVKDFEQFPGDVPSAPELVSIDGSFKVGRDGDKPGTLFPGSPAAGTTYRQEFSVGNAEDVATVLSTTYGFGQDASLDEHVPQALADHLCNDDCVVTAESTPIEPGAVARKYYARNIGVFLEIDASSGEINRLVGCNVDPLCTTLPAP